MRTSSFLVPLLVLPILTMTASTAKAQASSQPAPNSSSRSNMPLPTVGKAEGTQPGVLRLPDGSKFQTILYDLKVIGQLGTVHKLPYYVLSSIGCEECDANVSIYIHSPSDGPMKNEGTQPRFDYPGRLISREDHSVVFQARLFLGNCLTGHPDAVVWFERSIGNDKQWHKSVFWEEVKDDRLVYGEPKAGLPSLHEAENAVRKSECRELSGIDQWEEP